MTDCHFIVSHGIGVGAETWMWLCMKHYRQPPYCPGHWTVFMRKEIHREKQGRLI